MQPGPICRSHRIAFQADRLLDKPLGLVVQWAEQPVSRWIDERHVDG
jgi:hypothetical protein